MALDYPLNYPRQRHTLVPCAAIRRLQWCYHLLQSEHLRFRSHEADDSGREDQRVP